MSDQQTSTAARGGGFGGRAAAARERAVRAFEERFGRAPRVVARAPGRVNLIGEHIDYCGGLVLPLAIDRECVVAAGVSEDARTTVVATDIREDTGGGAGVWGFEADRLVELWADARARAASETPVGAAARSLEQRDDWARYVAGVFACVGEWLRKPVKTEHRSGNRCHPIAIPAMNVAIASDVPLGAGLSSSAALEVSLARAIVEVCGGGWEPVGAAGACRRAEQEYAGVPCGVMDQMIAACGVRGHALLIDCAPTLVGGADGAGEGTRRELVPMPRGEKAVLLVVDSGVRHALGGGAREYPRRVAVTKRAAEKLGSAWLCAVGEEEFARRAGVLSEEERRCARHVVREQSRVRKAVAALRAGDLVTLGRLMNESHDSLRDDFRVSCAELDAIVESARGVAGGRVFGARMTGGGFGGCAIVLVEPGSERHVRDAVARGLGPLGVAEPRMFVTSACEGASLL